MTTNTNNKVKKKTENINKHVQIISKNISNVTENLNGWWMEHHNLIGVKNIKIISKNHHQIKKEYIQQ